MEAESESALIHKIANVVSTLTVLSCIFLKVPQIMQVQQQKSAEGIYVQSLVMEITGFTIMCLYNYTNNYGVLTYLEYPIILVQVYVLLYNVLKYKRLLDLPIVPIAAGVYAMAVVAVLCGLSKDILIFFLPLCTPLSGFAKVSYMYGIVRAGNADAVSLTTWMISIATNVARIFTVYADSSDLGLMINFFISTLLSLGVLFTAVYYQTNGCFCNIKFRRTSRPQRNVIHPHMD